MHQPAVPTLRCSASASQTTVLPYAGTIRFRFEGYALSLSCRHPQLTSVYRQHCHKLTSRDGQAHEQFDITLVSTVSVRQRNAPLASLPEPDRLRISHAGPIIPAKPCSNRFILPRSISFFFWEATALGAFPRHRVYRDCDVLTTLTCPAHQVRFCQCVYIPTIFW